jgi:hypothetical protein
VLQQRWIALASASWLTGLQRKSAATCLHSTPLLVFAGMAAGKNDGNPVAGYRHETLEFQTTHSREPQIQDQAGGITDMTGVQKFLGRCESFGLKTEEANQPTRRISARGVIVYDR